ncbi:MAG: hypothetical protein DSY90_10290 [Deltaproteobacteria bacterium]|nr:MAG: hypothetical protein DSY90_10290 [Deltaproteobacteria bacterium]
MTDPFLLDPDSPVIPPFLDALETLFAAMDTAYEKVAEACGFHCDGCGDSCCQTRFYHHTLLEYLYLRKGWQALPEPDKGDILRRAVQVDNARTDSAGRGHPSMCPVNLSGRCRLYRFRPMICRLHGIAHELTGAEGGTRKGPGCDLFTRVVGNNPDIRLDRTPFYREMALLEKELRRQTGFNDRIRVTIARMILYAADKKPGKTMPLAEQNGSGPGGRI